MINSFLRLIQLVIDSFGKLCVLFVNLLPNSPFVNLTFENLKFLDTLNWVIPFNLMLSTISLWLVSIVSYYLVQIILRWVKAIQ